MTPTNLKGSEFEKLIVEQNALYERENIASIGRYGVQSSQRPDMRQPGGWEVVQIKSLPDFEGTTIDGYHIIFDAKAVTAASFSWSKYRSETRGAHSRQLRHMLKRSKFGANCFFLFHWNQRDLVKKSIPAETYVVPVKHDDDYWHQIESLEVRSITIDDCRERGVPVQWTTSDRGRKFRPDFLDAARQAFPWIAPICEQKGPST